MTESKQHTFFVFAINVLPLLILNLLMKRRNINSTMGFGDTKLCLMQT